ncbi:MAG: winged helix-turn-helix domain-containing protein [Candidatus Eremiobacteraeota bacterium]|nr:winged helix-turn-helix domain-containing protein [Candidatus Eremiobacteraeota bacterium]
MRPNPRLGTRWYELGPIRVDVRALTARHGGATVPLGAKAVAALVLLCANAGEVVTREELIASLWGDEPIDESSLWQTMYLLRRCLASHGARNAIENVRGRGYRLTGPVQALPTPTARYAWARTARMLALLSCAALITSFSLQPPSRELQGESARLLRLGAYYFDTQTESGLQRSEMILDQLVRREPRSARAFAALAKTEAALVEAYGPSSSARSALQRARTATQTALRLDPQFAPAMAAAATVSELTADRFGNADATYAQAIMLDPRDADAHEQFGVSLLMRGQIKDAITQFQAAATIDPTTAGINAWLAFAYYAARDPASALPFAVQALYLGDDVDDAHAVLGMIYARMGNLSRATSEFALLKDCCPRLTIAYMAQAYAQSRRLSKSRALLRRLHPPANAPPLLWLNIAFAQIMLGDRTSALHSLRHVPLEGAMGRSMVALDPRLDPVRRDPRFAHFVSLQLATKSGA